MIRRLFLDHPASVNETYAEHAAFAAGFGGWMLLGGAAALVHAVVPGWCTRTASQILVRLHRRVVEHRRSKGLPADPSLAFDWVI